MLRIACVLVSLVADAVAQPGPDTPLPPPPPAPPRFERRPSDERLFLTSTPLTMRRGAVSVSDDEGVSLRIAVGVSNRVQLDTRIGGLIIPGAVGGVLPLPGGIAAGGGAGVVLIGMLDIGVKVHVLDETDNLPGVALGYDMLDVFGLAAGGAGIVIVGAGGAGAGIVAVGGANLQFNLLTVAGGKHFGPRNQLTFGGYILDNHHYIPQAAGFASACGAGGVGDAGAGGAVEPCGGGGKRLDRVPVQVQPFVGFERAIGWKSSLATEVLFSAHLANTVGTTGVRWIFGHRDFTARIDLALLWSHIGYPLPWLGLGLHFR